MFNVMNETTLQVPCPYIGFAFVLRDSTIGTSSMALAAQSVKLYTLNLTRFLDLYFHTR